MYPFQVLLPAGTGALRNDSKAQAEQVRSIAFERIGKLLGSVSRPSMARIDRALRLHLAL